MPKTYTKKNKNTLTVTETITETHITEEGRTEIQTKIDHFETDKVELQKKIDAEKEKITILDK